MRKINLRLSLFCFVSMCLGVFAAVELIYGVVWVAIALGAIFVCSTVLTVIFKHSLWYVAALCMLLLAAGFCSVYAVSFAAQDREIVEEKVVLTGRVSDIGRNGNPTSVIYLEECVTDDYRLPGVVEMWSFTPDAFHTGDKVTVTGTLRSNYVFKSYIATVALRTRSYYNLDADKVISIKRGNMHPDEVVRKYVCDVMYANADEQSAGVLYALITGDRNAVDDEIVTLFENTGIVHLLAVSGLHVGVVVSLFVFLTRRLRLHPLVELVIVFVPLLAYAYLCGFGPSVVRAVVMTVCAYLCRALRGRVDLLTSLSWAGIVLLFVNPLYLYDVGFRLSFLSVYGIATLYTAISRLLDKLHMPRLVRKLIDALTMSLSCTLVTFAAVVHAYGKAGLWGVICNLFAIPLISTAFVFALVGLVPFVGKYIVIAADYLVRSAVWGAKLFGTTDTRVSVPVLTVTTIIVVVWLFAACGFVNIKRRGKIILNAVCATLVVVSMVFALVPKPVEKVAYVSVGYDEAVVGMLDDDGQAAVVTSFREKKNYSLGNVTEKLFRHNVKSVYWVVQKFELCNVDVMKEYVSAKRGDRVFVADHSDNGTAERFLAQIGVPLVRCAKNMTIGKGVTVTAVYDGDLRAVVLDADGFTVADVFGSNVAVSNFGYMRSDIDVYVMKYAMPAYGGQLKTTLSLYQTKYNCNMGANKYGNFTIRPKDGTINISIR